MKEKPVFAVLPKTQQILLAVHRILIEDCCFKVVLVEVVHYLVQAIILQKTASEHIVQMLDIFKLYGKEERFYNLQLRPGSYRQDHFQVGCSGSSSLLGNGR